MPSIKNPVTIFDTRNQTKESHHLVSMPLLQINWHFLPLNQIILKASSNPSGSGELSTMTINQDHKQDLINNSPHQRWTSRLSAFTWKGAFVWSLQRRKVWSSSQIPQGINKAHRPFVSPDRKVKIKNIPVDSWIHKNWRKEVLMQKKGFWLILR